MGTTEIFALFALISLLVSIAAFLLALGTSLRVNALATRAPLFDPGLPEGSSIPFDALGKVLNPGQLERFARGPSVAIFTSPDCPACRELYTKLLALEQPAQSVYVFESVPGAMANSQSAWWLTISDPARAVEHDFKVVATPQTFLIRDSKIQSKSLGPNTDWHVVAEDRVAVPSS